jgi:hypothetical protein
MSDQNLSIEVDARSFEAEMTAALKEFRSAAEGGTDYPLHQALVTSMFYPQSRNGIYAAINRGVLKNRESDKWVNESLLPTSLSYSLFQNQKPIRISVEVPARVEVVVALGTEPLNFEVTFPSSWPVRILDSFIIRGHTISVRDIIRLVKIISTEGRLIYTFQSKSGIFSSIIITAQYSGDPVEGAIKILAHGGSSTGFNTLAKALLAEAMKDDSCAGDGADGQKEMGYLWARYSQPGICGVTRGKSPYNQNDDLLGVYSTYEDALSAQRTHPRCQAGDPD